MLGRTNPFTDLTNFTTAAASRAAKVIRSTWPPQNLYFPRSPGARFFRRNRGEPQKFPIGKWGLLSSGLYQGSNVDFKSQEISYMPRREVSWEQYTTDNTDYPNAPYEIIWATVSPDFFVEHRGAWISGGAKPDVTGETTPGVGVKLSPDPDIADFLAQVGDPYEHTTYTKKGKKVTKGAKSKITPPPAEPDTLPLEPSEDEDDVLSDLGLSKASATIPQPVVQAQPEETPTTVNKVELPQKSQVQTSTEKAILVDSGEEHPEVHNTDDLSPVPRINNPRGVISVKCNEAIDSFNVHIQENPLASLFDFEGRTLDYIGARPLFASVATGRMQMMYQTMGEAWCSLLAYKSQILSRAHFIGGQKPWTCPKLEVLYGMEILPGMTEIPKSVQAEIPAGASEDVWYLVPFCRSAHFVLFVLYLQVPVTNRRTLHVYRFDSMNVKASLKRDWQNISAHIYLTQERPDGSFTRKPLSLLDENDPLDIDTSGMFIDLPERAQQRDGASCGYWMCWYATLIAKYGPAFPDRIRDIRDIRDANPNIGPNIGNFMKEMLISFSIGFWYWEPPRFSEIAFGPTRSHTPPAKPTIDLPPTAKPPPLVQPPKTFTTWEQPQPQPQPTAAPMEVDSEETTQLPPTASPVPTAVADPQVDSDMELPPSAAQWAPATAEAKAAEALTQNEEGRKEAGKLVENMMDEETMDIWTWQQAGIPRDEIIKRLTDKDGEYMYTREMAIDAIKTANAAKRAAALATLMGAPEMGEEVASIVASMGQPQKKARKN